MRKSMMKVAFLLIGILAAGSAAASAQTVGGSIAGGAVTRGKAARATVTLSIPGGLHVNSSRPNGEYAIPTVVKATSSAGVKIGGVNYPRGTNRKFEFSEKPLNVYEGRVSFTFPVTASPTFRGRQIVVNVSVRYQACTNEVCYAPKTKSVTLKAQVN
jgi:hypothetical protein